MERSVCVGAARYQRLMEITLCGFIGWCYGDRYGRGDFRTVGFRRIAYVEMKGICDTGGLM